jgi:hypothetical protein
MLIDMEKQDKEILQWAKAHREYIERRKRYLRYAASMFLWLGISVFNYYVLTANVFTLANGFSLIVGLEFEVALAYGLFASILRINRRRMRHDAAFAAAIAVAVAVAVAVAFASSLAAFAVAFSSLATAAASAAALTLASSLAFAAAIDDEVTEPLDKC